ncbi:hypothetical protein ATANTOWER_007587, partial [Ataeniobius toweri]|nr:hypothetical protein [Ataeniobius toweri]
FLSLRTDVDVILLFVLREVLWLGQARISGEEKKGAGFAVSIPEHHGRARPRDLLLWSRSASWSP